MTLHKSDIENISILLRAHLRINLYSIVHYSHGYHRSDCANMLYYMVRLIDYSICDFSEQYDFI
jgi:hypothetical protein